MSKIFYLFFFIFYDNYDFCYSTPLVGENAKRVEENEFPFVVSLSFNNTRHVGREENNHICGGILISFQHVLTAAHCFIHVNESHDIVVKIGSTDLRNSENLEVAWWVFYKQWVEKINRAKTYHDVAIVKLRKYIREIQPGIIAFHRDIEFHGKTVVTAGWGRMENNEIPRFLRKAELNVLEPVDCLFSNSVFPDNDVLRFYVPGSLLCTAATPPVLLKCGDSGSPLVYHTTEVIGINLGGCKDDLYALDSEYQNYHASVNYYKTFIYYVIRK